MRDVSGISSILHSLSLSLVINLNYTDIFFLVYFCVTGNESTSLQLLKWHASLYTRNEAYFPCQYDSQSREEGSTTKFRNVLATLDVGHNSLSYNE
jgi:hypothetical protein